MTSKYKVIQKATAIVLFSIAMALLESAVVVYLRALYYPDGFNFPMKNISDTIGITELLRELATLVMLAGIGFIAGTNKNERWAWFMIAFGIWDIFYYVFLYLLIGWPVSLGDMDILFLIPWAWFGPVYAPVLVSMALIAFGTLILYDCTQDFPLGPPALVRRLFIAACVLIILSFTYPFLLYSIHIQQDLRTSALSYLPEYDSILFGIGYSIMTAALLYYGMCLKNNGKKRIVAYF